MTGPHQPADGHRLLGSPHGIASFSENVHALLSWLDKARETMVLPRISATNTPAGSPDILHQIALGIGSNPYVYFQDDDDPLP